MYRAGNRRASRNTSVVQPVQQSGVLDRDARHGYPSHVRAVGLMARVRRVHRERRDGPDERGHGAVLGRHAGSGRPVRHRFRVRHVRLIVHDDLAADLSNNGDKPRRLSTDR